MEISPRGSMVPMVIFLFIATAAAQPSDTPPNSGQLARFSPSMAVIVVVLVSALFFMGFFSIYIRHCSDSSGAAGSLGRALSLRARRAAAARGLEQSILETFPTFPYSEVKDLKIGKGGLECAVCLNEFEGDETLRLLPKCDHVFHAECIDAWLASHVTCPVCRANLAVQQEADVITQPESTDGAPSSSLPVPATNSDEIAIQITPDNDRENQQAANSDKPNLPPRSWSVRRPKILGLSKFRSHSTGHSLLVQPAENLDRFTLKLPAQVRKDVIDRAMLNRTRSCAVTLPRESSSRRGYRPGGEGSSRPGRSYRRIELPDRAERSDRWDFFTRMLSMKSPKVGAAENTGEGSNSKRNGGKTPVKMPSFKCLEPKADAADEAHLFSGESGRSPV